MVADPLEAFHPLVAGWFRERFGAPTDPQREGWPRIAAGEDVLIAAPTGSGKTLAAFLACMDALVRRGLESPLENHTDILYISPLKALSNDVQRNLEGPLAELKEYAAARGVALPEIRVAVRTGDTPASERAKLAKRPAHILVTTPESLYILLTTVKGRLALGQLRTVIVDEIHAVAGDKRGAHLALSLERLDRLVRQGTGRVPVRVGLSATQRPIETIARLLVGTRRPLPHIVDAGHRREIDLAIEITDDELGAVASNEQFGRVYDRIAELVQQHRSTIVFVNTRRLVERAAAALEQRLGEEHVVAHHGSMSRALRLGAEQKLKFGQVKCAVATASLELGIDVGAVDLVVQIGSPRSISTLLQRVGRSGHHLGGTPKGRLFALTRDQLVECASLVRGLKRGNLDKIVLRDAPLDILAQQIVASCAAEDMREEELVDMIRGATPYANLDDVKLEQILEMLAEGVSDRRGRSGAHVHRDRIGGTIKARRGARLAAITCGGAIPDNNNYAVVQWPEEMKVGEVDEDFAIESSAGDIFQLGNTAWRIRRVEMSKVIVEDAKGQPPTIPFWFGEAPARTRELSDEVSDLRGEIDRRLGQSTDLDALATWLVAECAISMKAAQQLVAYLAAARMALGGLPRKDLLIAERFFDEGGGMQLVLHSPLGGRINRAWGLALRKKFCVTFDFELQAAATDDGIVISLGQPHSFPLDTVFGYVPSHQTEETLVQALLDRPMFEIRWRWNVTRSLTVLRRRAGKRIAPHLVKMRAADTLSVVFPQAVACGENIAGPREVPDHPLVYETIRDCLVEAMDLEGLRGMIEKLERGEIQVMARDTVEPSPLSHELINANPYAFLDDAPLEERRTRAVTLRRGLPTTTVSSSGVDDVGAFDPAAIAAAADEVAPVVRDADELHDALLALWLVPEPLGCSLAPGAEDWFAGLAASGRAVRMRWRAPVAKSAYVDDGLANATDGAADANDGAADVSNATSELDVAAWVATERLGVIRAVLGDVECVPAIETPTWAKVLPREEAIQKIVSAHLDHRGPVSGPALALELGLPIDDVLGALLALEGDGGIMRGAFTEAGTIAQSAIQGVAMRAAMATANDSATLYHLEWCNRRVLSRIHRLTLARLRREIEPVSAAALMRFLLRWQRVAKHTQVIGADGLARIVEQLQGFETAAGAWEREVLPARLCNYDPSWLDQLCLSGHVVWSRLSPRTASTVEAEPAEEPPPRRRPRSADPNDPYNIAERAADTASRSGATREQIAAAAATALTGKRTPGYGEQVIVQLVTTSALMRRAAERGELITVADTHLDGNRIDGGGRRDGVANNGGARDASRDPADGLRSALDQLAAADGELAAIANALIDAADARDTSPVPGGSRRVPEPNDSNRDNAFPLTRGLINDLPDPNSPSQLGRGAVNDLPDPNDAAANLRGPMNGHPDPLGRSHLGRGSTNDVPDPNGLSHLGCGSMNDVPDPDGRSHLGRGSIGTLPDPHGRSHLGRGSINDVSDPNDPSHLGRGSINDVSDPNDPSHLGRGSINDVPDPNDPSHVGRGSMDGQPDPHDAAANLRGAMNGHYDQRDSASAGVNGRPAPMSVRRDPATGAHDPRYGLARGSSSMNAVPDPRAAGRSPSGNGSSNDGYSRHSSSVAAQATARESNRTATKRTAPGRSAPLALMLRADAPWLRAAAAVAQTEAAPLSELAARVKETLGTRGACFLGDVAAALKLQPAEIEDALWELVGAGLASADGFASLRVLVDRKRGEVKSLFDKARDAKDAAPPPVRTWADAIKKARTRDHRRPGHALSSLPTAAGRWSLLPAADTAEIDAEATARQLLQRYGVVFRDLVLRESSLPPWRDILVALRRLEARGEIRGGRFVSGFVGEQFALPEALDELRGVRNPAPAPCVCRVAATDPLNLVGILGPGPKVPAVVGNAVLYLDGHPVASVEAGHLILRHPLPAGARVDDDLTYFPPPRPIEHVSQAALPL